MTIWCNSNGMMARKPIIQAYFNQKLLKIKLLSVIKEGDVCIGWGNKPNSQKVKKQSLASDVEYYQLEDGFIGYIGHPANNGIAISLVADNKGIYYDARQSSKLESLVVAPLSDENIFRTQKVIQQITELQVTKYNCYEEGECPSGLANNLNFDGRKCILLVDQIANDLSVVGAMASEASFIEMIKAARTQYPNDRLLLKTHPDTHLSKKKGVLARMNLPDIEIINEHCHPHALIKNVDAVFTVSSQLGFEALLFNVPVYCFGMPFYAGWGLTHDIANCARRTNVSLEQLVHAALVQYSMYFNPVTEKKCEIEEVIHLISLQKRKQSKLTTLYLVGFSLWKRAFIKRFSLHLAEKFTFVTNIPKRLRSNENILIWGNKFPNQVPCIRVEDGFIRSKGLGVNLNKPSSLCFDQRGIYFDSEKVSDLERLLNNKILLEHESKRGARLTTLLNTSGVSKYNVGIAKDIFIDAGGKKVILVVGQVDGDASIISGSLHIKNNESLLKKVKSENDQAYIIYKPHPDVVSGYRSGKISSKVAKHCIDSQVDNVSLISLYSKIDELHTMTSLSGFEALSHKVNVHVWGQPFYAGWGLTTDYYPPQRRERALSLSELVFISLIEYPIYIDWVTGLWISPEMLIDNLSSQVTSHINKQHWFMRQYTKLKALIISV